jgi:hypothetical protein
MVLSRKNIGGAFAPLELSNLSYEVNFDRRVLDRISWVVDKRDTPRQ